MSKLFLRFLLAGGIATICQYATLISLVEFFDANPVVASAVGFVIGAVVNYLINYVFTYKSTLPHRVAFPKFAATATIGLGINTSTMYLLSQVLALNYMFSQVVATGITLIWNFAVNTIWSFNHQPERSSDS